MIRTANLWILCFLLVPPTLCPRSTAVHGGDWLAFRGPEQPGGDGAGHVPVRWSENENTAWRADLPGRGVSSPIVVSGKVIVTASSGHRQDILHVLCFDATRGGRIWERRVRATGRTMCHPKTCMAAPTPASDGARIFAFYSTNDLLCLDLEGNLLWLRGLTSDYPNASSGIGMASSPIAAAGLVIVQVENQSESFAAGIDAMTGENTWKIPRSSKPNWSSPVLLRPAGGGAEVLMLESWDLVSAHDPATGRRLWSHEAGMNCIPSCAVEDDLVLAPSDGLTALRHGGEKAEVAWKSSRLRPGTSSPTVHEGKVYTLNSNGILACGVVATGETLWQLRLNGSFSSTPVVAGGYIYCINEEGSAQVVRLGDKGELAGTSDFKETILATPAVSGGALYVRSDGHLWKIAAP